MKPTLRNSEKKFTKNQIKIIIIMVLIVNY